VKGLNRSQRLVVQRLEPVFFDDAFGLFDLIDADHEDRLLVALQNKAVGVVDVDPLGEEDLRQFVQTARLVGNDDGQDL